MVGALSQAAGNRMPQGRRGAPIAASALAVVAGSACGAPVDITELRVAAATRAEPTTSAQAIPQRLPPAQVERADLALSDCPGQRRLFVVVTGDVLLHPPLVEQAQLDGAAAGLDLDFALCWLASGRSSGRPTWRCAIWRHHWPPEPDLSRDIRNSSCRPRFSTD